MTADTTSSGWVACFRHNQSHRVDEVGPGCLYAPSAEPTLGDLVAQALTPLLDENPVDQS